MAILWVLRIMSIYSAGTSSMQDLKSLWQRHFCSEAFTPFRNTTSSAILLSLENFANPIHSSNSFQNKGYCKETS
ncbi:hypothetical protein SUGI_0286890 [Cryptomeria japonica]|nr:hypothetical protein SUGI_0286890 [Cryptomeria japonica]